MNVEKLDRYMHDFMHLKGFEQEAKDLQELQLCIDNFNRNNAKELCSYYSLKYESMINRVGNFYYDMHVLRNTDLYYVKTDDDVYDDLVFIRNVIIIYICTRLHIYPSIQSAVEDLL